MRFRRSVGVAFLCCAITALALAWSSSASTSQVSETKRFCNQIKKLSGPVPRSYVGSAKHIRDANKLVSEAPRGVRAYVKAWRDYIRDHVSPDDPASQDIENFPRAIQTAISRIQSFTEQKCGLHPKT